MKKLLFAVGLVLLASCSKDQGTNAPQTEVGEKYPIEFRTPILETKAPASGYGNLVMATKINLSVFKQNSTTADFLGCHYLVSEKNGGTVGLSFDNSVVPDNDRQKIVELSVGTYNVFAAGVNDGGVNELTPTAASPESGSYYPASHGKEYIRAEIKDQVITNAATSRTILMSFTREVAMLKFTLISGGSVTLPSTTPPGLITDMQIALPTVNPANTNEGKFFVQTGIIPLTGVVSSAMRPDVMKASKEGQTPGIYAYVLPCNLGAVNATYKLQFTLDINGTPRTFELNHIPMPTDASNNSVFAKGTQYSYTVTINNTGLYISEVQIADWTNVNQGSLTAE